MPAYQELKRIKRNRDIIADEVESIEDLLEKGRLLARQLLEHRLASTLHSVVSQARQQLWGEDGAPVVEDSD